MAGRVFQAFVERHHDVAAERELDVHGGFGREQMRVAIQMRAEQHALFGDLAQIAQAEDLEAAGVGEDGARPGHEAVQAAELADQFVAGAQEEMVGVGEDDLGVEIVRCQVALHDAFDRGLRADRHEDGRFDDAVRGVNEAGARAGGGADGFEFEMHYFRPLFQDASYISLPMQNGDNLKGGRLRPVHNGVVGIQRPETSGRVVRSGREWPRMGASATNAQAS